METHFYPSLTGCDVDVLCPSFQTKHTFVNGLIVKYFSTLFEQLKCFLAFCLQDVHHKGGHASLF